MERTFAPSLGCCFNRERLLSLAPHLSSGGERLLDILQRCSVSAEIW